MGITSRSSSHRIQIKHWAALGLAVFFGVSASNVEAAKADNWKTAWSVAQNYALTGVASPTVDHNVAGKVTVVRNEALRLYQKVQDASPPREIELQVRLNMLSRMIMLYDSSLGEDSLDKEALPLYEELVKDFEDWPNHWATMAAKIHLASLYTGRREGPSDSDKALKLYWEVINVPEDQIIFDYENMASLNLDNIATAISPNAELEQIRSSTAATTEENERFRLRLLGERKLEVDNLRGGAIRNLVLEQVNTSKNVPEAIMRMDDLKKQRTEDAVFQQTLQKVRDDYITDNLDIPVVE